MSVRAVEEVRTWTDGPSLVGLSDNTFAVRVFIYFLHMSDNPLCTVRLTGHVKISACRRYLLVTLCCVGHKVAA
jgi:hypothetical protein